MNRTGRPIRVAHFAGTMRFGHDGVTKVLYRMTTALTASGVDHIFVSPILPPPGERTVPMVEVPSVAFPLYRDYRVATPLMRTFVKQVLEFKPDLLHIHSPCSLGHAAVRFGRKQGIPVVATYHTHFASYARYYNVRMLEQVGWNYLRRVYDGCDRVFVPSLPILDELWAHGFRRLKHLPHGVDTTQFHPSLRSSAWRAAHGIRPEQKVLLYAGRLVWEKDLRTLEQAYRILMGKRRDVVMVMAGDGPLRAELGSLMPGAVFLGQLSPGDLATAYASSDLFVFPSTTETFGNVIAEAMASGVVPVCARQGGAAGVVQHGVTGLLTAPRDPGDFAAGIEQLLASPAQRTAMAEQALTFARRQSWDAIFAQMIEEYHDILTEYARRSALRGRKAA